MPVSYTHLDVYKRQVRYRPTSCAVGVEDFTDTCDLIKDFLFWGPEYVAGFPICIKYSSSCTSGTDY